MCPIYVIFKDPIAFKTLHINLRVKQTWGDISECVSLTHSENIRKHITRAKKNIPGQVFALRNKKLM